MKLSVAIAVLASALAEAHCKKLSLSSSRSNLAALIKPLRHLPQHCQLGGLAICPDDNKLPEQRARNGRHFRADPLLRTQPRHGGRGHLLRHGRFVDCLQRQGVHLPPGSHGFLHRQSPGRPNSSYLGRQGAGLVQDLPGQAHARREHDLALARYVFLAPKAPPPDAPPPD